ncbi:AAA domain-containing protein [Rhodopseudomonas palustris]|uniref:Superfamily I DNA and RNA helicases and helicase subunits-like n=1 Tax=Rhodopseudomonas palustris (strain BisB18) TaxID=316056 RepID=Q20ZI4_RHOPB
MPPTHAKRQPDTLAERFALEETFLSSPNTAALKSAVIRAIDRRTGDPVVLKYWEKTGTAVDTDFRELWRHEMRQSERVRAYPRADEVVVEVLASGESDDAFYIVMPSDVAPLEHASRFVRPDHWLRALQGPRQRALLWKNLRRLAESLGAVHGQGLVHGRIDGRAVYSTGAATTPDFRLGGFEFCLRVAELNKAPLHVIAKSRPVGSVIFSFLDDWRALGQVGADLIGLDADKLEEEEIQFIEGRAKIDLRASEIDLIRLLFEPERNRILDAATVTSRIDAILNELDAEAFADNGRYVLALRLGPTSQLSATLCAASGDTFDNDDSGSQVEFIRADLETGASLTRTARGDLLLMTESLVYDLQPLRVAGADETWNVASCNNARFRDDVRLGRRETIALPAHRIEIVRFAAASRRLNELRSDALDWSAAFDMTPDGDPTLVVRRGLLLAQIAEALFKGAEIAPVELVNQRRQGDKRIVEIAASDSEHRTRLSQALGVGEPHQLMRRLFDREEADVDAEWQLTEAAGLGMTVRSAAGVRFIRPVQKNHRRLYEFEILDGVVPPHSQLHLRKVDETGTEQVLRRRLRMLTTLSTQSELARMLADPRERLRTYQDDPLVEDDHFGKLDESKQEALRSIWSTGPGQFVVGPPGVGKTRLVTEVVRRALAGDPTIRLLLSAQAHQALDHLAASVQKMLKKTGLDNDVILVRSKADNGADLSGAQTPDRAKAYLQELKQSSLYRRAPRAIQQTLRDMTTAAGVTGNLRARLSLTTLRQRRSFEALVLQSANVLFSTTNSGDLARLIDDGALFDWTIIEEAAKATGSELLAPQLLSMRRMLIGDHNQLPPFDTDRIAEFLQDQTRVKSALAESDLLIGNIFRDFGLDDLKEAIEDDGVLSETCASARRMLLLFESLVTGELDRQKRSDQRRRRVATELLQQHRMHPAIATVISECFYDGTLETPKERETEFHSEQPPFTITDERLPASPIVFIDLPYVQREGSAGEQRPTYHNPAELQAALSVLGMLKPAPKKPEEPSTLAVLSPYNEQVGRLGRAIEDALQGKLVNIVDFKPGTNASGFESTVDSFQGSEADVVVVSLVRNNDHVGRRALGILRDRRRMNVLLSRAKWKLIIIGSMEFLRVQGRRYRRHSTDNRSVPAFLAKMSEVFDQLAKETLPDGKTPKFKLVTAASLMTVAKS